MKSAAHWRILNHLYLHKHRRLPLTVAAPNQDVGEDVLIDLDDRGLISATTDGTEVGLRHALRLDGGLGIATSLKIRLRLTGIGIKTVINDPGNHIRTTLGAYPYPIMVCRLYGTESNNIVGADDVVRLQQLGHITITRIGEPDDEIWPSALDVITQGMYDVALTIKGRDHLPR
ncbi:hypothetical protein [Actinoplanes sp. HUAS TT8]|uniref:hypothetical protein n=1 Tax=Actinoplanes sp. HUAS TT8 TaxID=3447453 RepID=UPI003F51FB75